MSNEERATIGTVSDKGKMPLTRLQRIITGESSKAVKLKNKTRPARKAKTQQNRRSCMSDKLALILQMPMEVFCEIAGYLAPLYILHISRSTKGLRGLLMSKTARLIWRTTMRAMEIPKTPGDINEPQLVSLLFETFCQGCGAPRVKKVDYGLRVRLCPGAALSWQAVKALAAKRSAISMAFPRGINAVFRLCCFERAFVTGPLQNGSMTWPDELYAQQKFFIPDLTDAIRQYKLYDADSEDRKDFIKLRTELAVKICAHATAIHKWESVQSNIKANSGLSKIESRKESILKKLKELGYTDKDLTNNCSSNSSEWSNIICQPRDLTERTWKSILPQLEAIIATRRRERAAEVLSALRVQRWTEFRSFYTTFSGKWKDLEGSTPTMPFEDL